MHPLNLTLAAAVLAASGSVALAQQHQGNSTFFEFPLRWDDTSSGVATDVSFLNDAPAGSNGRIVVRDGHFVEEDTGERVRFFGTNIGADEAFPEKADAEMFAKRLAKAGVNVVRLHHLDNPWAIQTGGSIWDPTRPDRQVFDPAQLDKLDYLIAELKKNGIYVNLNLKVSKELTPADGLAESITEVPWIHQKRIDYFQDRMVELQKDYARKLLTHINPYTQMSYAEDPAIAFVEINNENSLMGFWTRDLGRGLEQLPEPFKTELADEWTAWLKDRYGSDEQLTEAWNAGATEPGPSVIPADKRWTIEQQGGSEAALTQDDAAMQQQGAGELPTPARIDVNRVSGTDWHVQAHLTGLTLQEGATYTLKFRIRADEPRTVPVNVTKDIADWNNLGLSGSVRATPEWEAHALVFTAQDTTPEHARVAFILGGDEGTVEISHVELTPGALGAGLQEGESVDSRVAIPVSGTKAQWDDWIAFLAHVERDYADQMLDFLRDELGVKGNVALTQIDYGGISGMHREARMDFADSHAYWQHPSFPGGAWDPANWTIANSPQVDEMGEDEFGALGNLAMMRVADKPFAVSEFDHPAPSDYVGEMLPTLATFAAVQDWDALYTFAIADYSAETAPDRILGYFDQNNHPAKWAFYPSAALIFRQGLVEPAGAEATVRVPEPIWSAYAFADSAWRDLVGDEPIGFLARRLGVSQETLPAGSEPTLDQAGEPGSQARLVETPSGQAYVVGAPAAAAFVGYVGGTSLEAGDVTLQTDAFGNDFASVTAVAVDGEPLNESSKVLVTVVGRVENQEMGWNADRTTVGTEWGHGPTVAEHVPATLSIPVEGERTVYVLDSTGARKGRAQSAQVESGKLTLEVVPQDATLLYEIAKE